MRERKLDQLAGTTLYTTGPTTGGPTKIAPPLGSVTEGKVPLAAFGSQWQNYLEHYLQRQIECSAQLPFRNWLDFTAAIPATTSPPRFAHCKRAGLTLVANGVNNSPKYYQDMLHASGGAPLGLTFAPGAGTFVPKCVVQHENLAAPSWFVGGSNSGATTKTLWKVTQNNTQTEITAPVAGSVENFARDPDTGAIYAFHADTNRTMTVLDAGGTTFSTVGNRNPALQAPAVATTFCAAGNGKWVFAHLLGGGDIELHHGTVSPFTSAVRTLSGNNSPVYDCRYSSQLGKFMVLTSTALLTFADPTGTIETFNHIGLGGGGVTVDGGCLHDTGCATYDNGDGGLVRVTSWPGDTAHAFKFGSGFSSGSGVFLRYDGCALWFMYDGGSADMHLFRSLRSL